MGTKCRKTRQRLTLPCLKTKYHQRCKLSRPSSEWGRVGRLRHNHLVILHLADRFANIKIKTFKILLCSFVHNCLIQHVVNKTGACAWFRDIWLYVCLIKPIETLVSVSFTHYCASTPDLSTWWSSTSLKRFLVSRGASRLDAFSGYPFRT